MKLEDQVCSLELAKRLRELGVKQESLFYWSDEILADERRRFHVTMYPASTDRRPDGVAYSTQKFSAFTVAELGEMLPWHCEKDGHGYFLETSKNGPHCEVAKTFSVAYYDGEEDVAFENSCDTEADARAGALIYLIENKLITV